MSDYGDTSGGYSDQQIRDIVAALNPAPPAAAAAPVGILPAPASVAPEVTPTMTYAAPSAGAPLSILPPAALVPAKPKEDDWAPAAPTMTPPPVTPLGAMAAVPARRVPTLGGVLGAR